MSITWRADRALLDPTFGNDIDTVLTADPATWIVICTGRDAAVEAAGYAKWKADPHQPKYTSPANSAHCCVPARAADVALVVNGKTIWSYDDPNWIRLYAAILAHPRLHSGKSFGDGDHVEQLHWKALRDA